MHRTKLDFFWAVDICEEKLEDVDSNECGARESISESSSEMEKSSDAVMIFMIFRQI